MDSPSSQAIEYETYDPIDLSAPKEGSSDGVWSTIYGAVTGQYPTQSLSQNPTSYDLLAHQCSYSSLANSGYSPLYNNSICSPLKNYTPSDFQQWAEILRLQPECQVYKNIELYVRNSGYGRQVQRIYKINRHGERAPFQDQYRILLWHGTSPSGIAGIIQTGLRKGNGGLFGGGVYFADRLAKSIGYCRQRAANGNSFFILAEVAPGRVYKAAHFHLDYKSAPQGFDSVKGNGMHIPTWSQNELYNGAILPCGVTKINTRHKTYDMTYNEYIIYDPDRIIVRFVVECS